MIITFLLETIVKPLMLKVPIKEIPANWQARSEGESQNTFIRTFAYIRIAIQARFYKDENLLEKSKINMHY